MSRGWPECVQAAAATALLVGESRKLNPAAFLWRGGNGLHLFIDGSSRVIQGKRHNGCAIVEGVNGEIRETGRLPNNWSAQTCQPQAVSQALQMLEGKEGTIRNGSRYAFGEVHTFGKIWEEWGLINSKGKELVHEELVGQVLWNLMSPIEVAVVHVNGHQRGNSFCVGEVG